MLDYFVNFVVGEINQIDHVIIWAEGRNHPETAMNKIRQIVVARQEVAIYARDVLMEQWKLPNRQDITAAAEGRSSTSNKKKKSKGGISGPGESSMQAMPQKSSTATRRSRPRGKAKSMGSSFADVT